LIALSVKPDHVLVRLLDPGDALLFLRSLDCAQLVAV